MWHFDHQQNKTSVSLRSDSSRESSTNVRQIAEMFGGGGHRCAAGFSLSGCVDIIDMLNRKNSHSSLSFIREYYSYIKQQVTPYWWVLPVMGLFFVSGKMSH
jgi:nanoRNase/pAp phosphatase (c-di-AMP/oligoRNAs hydrolase)